MCFKNIKTLIEQKNPSPRAKNLYLWLKADAEEKQTHTIWFKQAELAQAIGISVRTLQRLLKELVDMKMIEKKEEKHEKKFPVYQIQKADRDGAEQKRSEIVFDHQPNLDDQKLVAERLPDTVKVCDKSAVVAARVNNIANEGRTPEIRLKRMPAPIYKNPRPTYQLAPGEKFYCPPMTYFECVMLPCPPTGEVEMACCENVLTMDERKNLRGNEPISKIPEEKLPFTFEMIMGLYGDKLEERFPNLDGQEGRKTVAEVLHYHMSQTMWLKYPDPLDHLYKMLATMDGTSAKVNR